MITKEEHQNRLNESVSEWIKELNKENDMLRLRIESAEIVINELSETILSHREAIRLLIHELKIIKTILSTNIKNNVKVN